jgi:hypothetical protein
MRQSDAMLMRGRAARPNSTLRWHLATKCRVITYMAAVPPLVLVLVLASLYPDLNRIETPDWRSLVSRADEASNSGDRYEARRLYLQVDRVAYWQKDWEGLVTAACRINKLDAINLFPFCSARRRRRKAPRVVAGLPPWQNLSHCSARMKPHLQWWPESDPVGQTKK